jgi:hypothetical protein
MAGQLDVSLATILLSRVSLGIIPQGGSPPSIHPGRLWIYDNFMVGVETPTAKL